MKSSTDSKAKFPSSENGLRQYLERVLPDAKVTTESVHSKCEPLLVMRTTYVMAAFGFPNGDPHNDYQILYGGFRNYYLQQSHIPNELELAFVLCVQPDVPNLDILSSRVETDVYFCRKFVIRFFLPLNKSLARLPFLPLSPLGAATLRPPSAQTFLQKCGLSANFAKYLVVQRERSPERIVEDCLTGELGEPIELTPMTTDSRAAADRIAKRTRLKSIKIKNFRVYRKSQKFRLGADVTVLCGANGFGKTSVFDAIDFVATGDIGRLRASSDSHFGLIAKHLDSNIRDSAVTLSIASDGNTRVLRREVNNRKQGTLDGRATDRKTILAELTGGEFPSADRIENFVSLFRATHLFSQEHQELMKDFHPHCVLSDNIVSRLLAFEDYANAANKAARVRDIFQSRMSDTKADIRELSEQIRSETEEIKRLSSTQESHGGIGELEDAIELLRREITTAGIPADNHGSHLDKVRRWRATIEVQQADAQAEIDRLTILAKDAAEKPKIVAEIARSRKQLEQAQTELKVARKKQVDAELGVRNAEVIQAEISARRNTVRARAETLLWIRDNKTHYDALLIREREAGDTIERVKSSLAEYQGRKEDVRKKLLANEEGAQRAKRELERALKQVGNLEDLNKKASSWETWNIRLAEVGEEERKADESFLVLEKQEREIAAQLEAVLATETRLEEIVGKLDKSQSEVRRILLDLKGRIHNGVCLLCGEDYGSPEELLRRVDEQIETDTASPARMELAQTRARATSLSEDLALSKERRVAGAAELKGIRGERAELIVLVRKFEEAIVMEGIPIGASAAAQIKERFNLAKADAARVTQEVDSLSKVEMRLREDLLLVEDEIGRAVSTKAELDDGIEGTRAELEQLRGDWRAARVSLDVEPERLTELEQECARETAVVASELESADNAVRESKGRVGALQQEVENLEAEVNRLLNEVSELNNTFTRLSARLEAGNLGADVEEKTVLSSVAVASQAQAECLRLRDRTTRLEQAIDWATTAGALAQGQKRVQERKARRAVANQSVELYASWIEFFDAISDVISSQRNRATENFTREYGPRTSVIQRRLRSVYGFDEVEIQSHGSTIRVRVKRREEELRPTDYFSQSQQQTLLLGLFLTTCISQTWSSLSAVLLDDPFTHFDNLNTYAFLDLIAGLVDSESGGHQFIISTCDEKFFQLARQRFRHLQERATFYMFSAIDENGPIVEVVPS